MLDHYRRLLSSQQWDGEALCFTYAQGLDQASLIEAFGGDPGATMSTTEMVATQARFHYSKVPPGLLVADLGTWCIGIEPNGFQGSRPEVRRRAAIGGAVVSVYWNVNAHTEFGYTTGGRTAVGFDLLNPENRHGADPHVLDAEMAGLPFGSDIVSSYAAGLLLAERVTGIRLPADLPERDLPSVLLKRVPQDLVPEEAVGHPALDDPFVRSVVAEPTADKLRAIDGFLARLIALDSGVIDEPAVRAGLEAFIAGSGELAAHLRDALLAVQERYRLAHQATLQLPALDRGNALPRLQAVQDVVAALLPDQRRGGKGTVHYRHYGIRGVDAQIQAHVLQQCAVRAKHF